MTNIKFETVFAEVMASGDHQQSIILRVDDVEVFEGLIGQGETLDINVKLPITTLAVEMGTRTFDALGHPSGFRNFAHVVQNPPPSEEDVWKVTLFDDNLFGTLFRSHVPGHEGKFELKFSFH